MKKVLSFMLMFFVLFFMAKAQDATVSVNGVVSDEATGNPIQNHEVQVIIGDSLNGGGFYQLFTNNQGYYSVDSVLTGGYGTVQTIVLDCNYEPQVQEGMIVPGNNSFTFDFSICVDSIPQGDCQNFFWYESNDLLAFNFYGESYPIPADNFFWDFGDGSTGEGTEVTHTYDPNTGEVALVTLTTFTYDPATGDSCFATSEQEVWLGGSPGGDCMNWFSYSTGANNTMTFYGESLPLPADEYLWDFGDGTTGEGQEIDHQYDPNLGDMFVVTLTTTSYDSIGEPCTAASTQEVWVFNGGGNNCENWFWYDTDDNISFIFYGESYPFAADDYLWDFGDGTTGSGQEADHTFDISLGDVFYVTLTTFSYDPSTGDSCTAQSMQEVWVGNNPGGDCENFFWFESTDVYTFNFMGESFPFPADYYSWDFGDGTTAVGQQVEHTFDPSLGDVFTVCLTTYSYANNDSCSATSCQEIELSGQIGQQLMGTVYIDGEPADYAMVGLFGMDNSGSFIYDFVMTEPQTGTYFFDNVPEGEYYIMASLTPQSPEFVNYFPTYYGDALFWFDATVITLGTPVNPYDINLIEIGSYTAGPGNIGGTITIGEGKGSPGNNINVILMDEDENALTFTTSDENGLFDFSSLGYGTYKLKVEMTGKSSEIASIVIDSENQEANLDFIVKSSSVVLSAEEGFDISGFAGEIYPNPVANEANLELTLKEPLNATVSIYNQTGQIVYNRKYSLKAGRQLLKANISDLSSGIYLLKINDGSNQLTKRFIKQ